MDRAISSVLQPFAAQNLQPDQIAVTLVDLREPTRPESAGFRGGERIYPASVIKMFYLVAAHRWLEDGRLTDTEELRRALRDMIVDSYNEATGYIVDLLTGHNQWPGAFACRIGRLAGETECREPLLRRAGLSKYQRQS